jgi:hypothetical protein
VKDFFFHTSGKKAFMKDAPMITEEMDKGDGEVAVDENDNVLVNDGEQNFE